VSRSLLLAGALLLFALVATANSGGYRYGVSDQAFYVPAIALDNHPDLFPRDRAVLGPQLRLWPGGRALAAITRWTGDDLPHVFAIFYVVTLVALGLAALALARSLGLSAWAASAFLVLLSLRHRIAKTGANSLEGYAHPRMLAFAIGLGVLACVVRRRWWPAAALLVLALIVHPTTGAWFAIVAGLAAWWPHRPRASFADLAVLVVIVAGLLVEGIASGVLTRMDADWLSALADKDYLFPAAWPAYAWVTNLAYPVIVFAIYARRRRIGVVASGELGLVAGLILLVAGFLVSVPLTQLHVALAVQLQVNRVFWLLDAAVALYLAWWLVDDVGRRRGTAIVAILAIVATGRGIYILKVEARRPLVQMQLPADAWTDAMSWLSQQPASWNVLADPGHAWKYGSSVRVAALRDTVLEAGKDSAMAMYDRSAALRVVERARALAGFDSLSTDQLRTLDARYDVDVVVEPADRPLALPVLYRNAGFAIYDLR
jgi:hypothetical protein